MLLAPALSLPHFVLCCPDSVIRGYEHFQAGACKGKLFPTEEWAQQPDDQDFAAGLEGLGDNEEEEEEERDIMEQLWRFQAGL